MAKIRALFASRGPSAAGGVAWAVLALLGAFLLGRKSKSWDSLQAPTEKSREVDEAIQQETAEVTSATTTGDAAERPQHTLSEVITEVKDDTVEYLHDLIEDVKPKLRGWLHLGSVPLILIGGMILLILAPTRTSRLAAAVFILGALLTFGVSAVYHRGNGVWSRDLHLFFKKLDHCNIFVLIGASASGFAILLLEGGREATFLTMLWSGVTLGIVFKTLWISAPRWLGVTLYIVLGWTPIIFVRDFWEGATEVGPAHLIIGLILAGGILYMVGALIYGFKLFNGSPRVWGFHETFHLFTILAFVCHYVAISVVAYSMPIS